MDKIKIEDLEVFAYHGVYPEENENGQNFYINATLYLQTREAGKSDNLTLSVHYGEVCHFMNDFMKQHTFQLIETVAERMAEAVLLQFPLIEVLQLEIRKPSAPIGLPFASVSVEIERAWHTAYIAIGSNMGDKQQYIEQAIEKIKKHPLLNVISVSKLLVTKPYGGVEQEDFLNGAMEIRTLLLPEELLDFLHEIEQQAGRERLIHWGPRTLDLDIIFYDNLVYDSETLTIPHADMHNREFVLIPMNDIAPYKRHAVLGKTVHQMLNELQELSRN
ncbi:MAG: 2-amino-4-hydroxy-6-hydroxymethyldihydropteridine diphosphokinase [Lachnospiraceae bacterium]|nr:2-amino-4-hydroxy-6-hydroxymethyldihydropteridine diphosphokinase [Lachnospiraceae bacterium]